MNPNVLPFQIGREMQKEILSSDATVIFYKNSSLMKLELLSISARN